MNSTSKVVAVAGLLALTIVTLAHPSATRMQTWPWAVAAAGLWLMPVGLLGLVLARGKILHLPNALVVVGLMLLAAAAVISTAVSPFAGASLPLAWPTLGGVALCFGLHHWLRANATANISHPARLAIIFAGVGTLVACVSLIGWLASAPGALPATRNTFPFGHSTYTGGFVVMIFPWLAAQVCATRAWQRVPWVVAALLAGLTLAGTSSRGAVAGLAVVGAIGVAAALVSPAWTRLQKIFLVAAVLVLACGAVATNPRLRELVVHRSWGESARESNRQRSAMFDAGWRLGAERPLLGWGPGSVPLAYPFVRSVLDGGVDNVVQLHNAPVQTWATLGATGIVAVLLLLGGITAAFREARRAESSRALSLAAAASLAGYGVFALTDHQFDLPIIAAGIAANVALITAGASGRVWSPSGAIRGLLLACLGLLVAAPAMALLRDLSARRSYEEAVTAMEAQRLSDALAAFDRATARAPHDPYFQHQAAAALLRAADKETQPPRRTALMRDAAARLEASVSTGVHLEFAHFNLGWLQLELGAPASAARHFVRAANFVPDKGGVYFGLGLALLDGGQRDAAIRAFALEWINDPRQLTSPAWELPALAARRPAVRAEVMRLYAGLRTTYPAAVRAEAWTRWWLGEPLDAAELSPAFTSEASAFVAALPSMRAGEPLHASATAAWAKLYTAWRATGTPGVFTRLTAGEAPLAAALARRATRHRASFQDFLLAPTEDEAALLRTSRRERPGYGVLARHPDGPILADVYVVQENRVVADFAAGLFPPKGWLPGRFLLALLPALSLSNGPPDPR